jgi:hypothetical protein
VFQCVEPPMGNYQNITGRNSLQFFGSEKFILIKNKMFVEKRYLFYGIYKMNIIIITSKEEMNDDDDDDDASSFYLIESYDM